MSDASNQTSSALPEGTVIAGRYRVDRLATAEAGAELYEGRDLSLGERRVALVRVDVTLVDEARAAWMLLPPPAAPLLDVLPIDGGAMFVAPLPPGAERLGGQTSASREQRACAFADLADAIAASPAEPAMRWTRPGCLWVVSTDTALRTTFIPLPVAGVTQEAARGDDLAALATLTLAELYGIDADNTEDGSLRVPDALSAVILPWLANDGSAPALSPAAFARAVGVGGAAARVPVPTAPAGDAQGARARLASARRRIRSLAVREGIGFLVLLAALAVGFVALLGTEDVPYVSDGPVELPAVSVLDEPAVPLTLPELNDASLAPTALANAPQDGTYCRAWPTYAPIPQLTGCARAGVDPFEVSIRADGLSSNQPYVVAFHDDAGRLTRIDEYAPGRRFVGYHLMRYEEDALLERVHFDSYGQQLAHWAFDVERSEVEALRFDGTPVEHPCVRLRYTLDDAGRYTSWTCLDSHGDLAPFEAGYHEVQFEHSAGALQTRFLDAAGAPVNDRHGVAAVYQQLDEFGRETLRFSQGVDGEPVPDPDVGSAQVRTTYAPTRIEERALTADGQLMTGWEGWAARFVVASVDGYSLFVQHRDIEAEPIAFGGSEASRIAYETSNDGLLTRLSYLNTNDEPALGPDGLHAIAYVRDGHGSILQECHYGLAGPVRSDALLGSHCTQVARDPSGRPTSVRYYDERYQPMNNQQNGVHEVQIVHDAVGRVFQQWWFDAQGERTSSTDGTRGLEIVYGRFGQPERYENLWSPNEGLHADNSGIAMILVDRDHQLREIRRCWYDEQLRPVETRLGLTPGASCIQRTYRDGRIHRLTFLDAKKNPAQVAIGGDPLRLAAVLEYVWGVEGQLVQQRRFSLDGETSLGPALDCTEAAMCLNSADDGGAFGWYVP